MTLERLGLRKGERVRFLRVDKSRWQEGRITGLESDGSVRIRDGNGLLRSIALEHVLVEAVGPRGAKTWEPALDRVNRPEQLDLFG